MQQPTRSGISAGRRFAFYFGTALAVVGYFMVVIGFVGFLLNPILGFLVFFGGGVSLALSQFLRRVGRLGLAGSGVILDPEHARADLAPWARAGGQLLGDALLETRREHTAETFAAAKVRCPHCGALNDEAARYCNQCGTAL